jgi:hypothetical protein
MTEKILLDISIPISVVRVVAAASAALCVVASIKLASIAFGMIEMAFENGGNIPMLLTFSEVMGAVALWAFAVRGAKEAFAPTPGDSE